ncbi:helix-turn-helix transcriptional regulator [Paenibacillus sp. FSL H7-0326]
MDDDRGKGKPMHHAFGNYLKQLRTSKNLTQSELAEKCEITRAYLSHVETGERKTPSPEVLRKMSCALGVSYVGMLLKAGVLTEADLIFTTREVVTNHA